jgi:ribonuclease D
MHDKSAERSFNPMSVPGLSNKARDAVNAVFKSMSAWRSEIAAANESNGEQVLEKMAAAAAALGWPEQIVDAARMQIQRIGEMQAKTMDHMLDAWEEHLKSPNPMTASPSAMLSKLKAMPGFPSDGDWTNPQALQNAAAAPLVFWVECAKQWQKFWADSMLKANRG